MAISLGGLASGIDTGSLIESLMSVARRPINQMTAKKSSIDSASTTVTGLSTKLAALKTASLGLSTSVGFSSFAASSTDAGVVTTTTGSASIGNYSVTVSALARAQKSRSTTFASSTTALGMAGSLDLTVGTADPKAVSILNTDTLSDIAAKISASGARVSAAIMNDGTGNRLLIQGLDSGAENAFTVAENSVVMGFNTPGNVYETAQNASLIVDGMPISSKTNQVSNVIPGVKLALTKVTTSPATVTVTSDATALKGKITTFVNAYNDFVNASHAAAGFGGTKASNAVLSADSSIRNALQRIGNVMSNAVPNTSGKYTTMGSIGLTGSREGTLSLNATKFDAAMAADPESVRRLFVTDTSTGATGLMSTFMTSVDSLITGPGSRIQARIDTLSAQSKRLSTSVTKAESRLLDYEEQLKKQFTNMDQLVGKYKTQQSALSASFDSYGANNSGN